MKPAIRVENLSKQYQIGRANARRNATLRETIMDAAAIPWRRLRRLAHGDTRTGESEMIWALRDISFEVSAGQTVGIIGGNGAGKSTLLKILSRITEPTRGRVALRGRTGSLLEVGIGFHRELTGRENIYLSGAILGMKRAEIHRKLDEIVAFAEVEKFLDTPIKHYSSGMYMRLAFAVAAHLDPDILLVDEVLAVGDTAFQKKCVGKMNQVAGEGRTILFISHNMANVTQLCTDCILLSGGRIQARGDPLKVVRQYLEGSSKPRIFWSSARKSERPAILSARIADPTDAAIRYGERLVIELVCRAGVPATVAVELVLRDQDCYPIIFLPSGLRFGREFSLQPDRPCTIQCTIPRLPLAQGEYFLDLILSRSGMAVLEKHELALRFEVIDSDPCGTKRVFTQDTGQGCVHVDASFDVVEAG